MTDRIQPYEKYKLEWMIEQGHSLPQLVRELKRLEDECDEPMSVTELFDMWEEEYGFSGSLWVCFDEWKMYEGNDGRCDYDS